MKTKVVFDELQLNSVPCESLHFSDNQDLYVLVDDINEKRWKITFRCMVSFRVVSIDLGYNYNGKDFDCYRYIENGCRYFRNYILQVVDSQWVEQLKSQGKNNPSAMKEVEESKHFLITFHDYELEVVAKFITINGVN